MQRIIVVFLALIVAIMAGCSKSSPTGSTPPAKPLRIVVTTPASAPSLTDPNSAVWNGVTSTPVPLSDQNAAKIAPGLSAEIATLPDSVYLQALRLHDSLYLRIRWHDATHDVWRGRFAVADTLLNCNQARTCVDFIRDTDTFKEDQTIVLFDGLPNSKLDALVWRALTTGQAQLCEGGVYTRGTKDSLLWDAGTLDAAYENLDQGFLPTYMHLDSCLFHGSTLYIDANSVPFDIFSKGWAIGQRIPGYYIDSSLANKTVDARGSRWDTRAADIWDTTSQTYTLVLSHPMYTGFIDDLDLAAMDSVLTEVGIFNNQLDLNVGGVNRGFTKSFWLVLQ